MGLNVHKYEGQIRAILQAPGVDLSTISAKRVRKQLLEQNEELSPELVKTYKEDLDTLIGQIYEQVSAGSVAEEDDDSAEHGKRKRNEESPNATSKVKKVKKETKKEPGLSDAQLAKQLSHELNGRDRGTRASSSAKPKVKRARKTKSSATVDSDGEGGAGDGEDKPKRRGGFSKEYTLSEPLAALLGTDKLSRPQVVKHIWEYIKANERQNPDDKREILCDENLRAIFGVDRIGMFKMNKQLGEHLYEPSAE
ncbi:SWIB-domain-containing protein [Trametopsis cervina]|nr:SWIB-domain-containing protein [Trametopsis cervina]